MIYRERTGPTINVCNAVYHLEIGPSRDSREPALEMFWTAGPVQSYADIDEIRCSPVPTRRSRRYLRQKREEQRQEQLYAASFW
jgi:hypothetical protein